MTREELQNIARQFTKGFINEVVAFLFIILCIGFLIGILFLPIDDCDVSKWDRCGLKVRVDNKTGIEYLETSKGGIIRRYEN